MRFKNLHMRKCSRSEELLKDNVGRNNTVKRLELTGGMIEREEKWKRIFFIILLLVQKKVIVF